MTEHRALALALVLLAGPLGACDSSDPVPPSPAELESEAEAPARIEARVRVRVEAAREAALDGSFELTGMVEPQAQVVIKAETAGRVLTREIERGQRVEAGARLYTLDGSRARIELQRAKAQEHARETDLAQAERERARNTTLHAREGIADATLERSVHANESAAAASKLAQIGKQAAARGLRDAKLRAPFAGIVAEFHVELGDYLAPGSPVVTLVDLSRVRLRVGLTAAELELVEVGQELSVEFSELGGARFAGEVRSVSPLVDPRTGTYAAELWLDNPDERLRQGMLGRVELDTKGAASSLSIPRKAVIRRGGRYSVWVLDPAAQDPARVFARELSLGRAQGGRVAVLAGLAPGEQVITEGMFALREGAAVEVEGGN